MKQVLRSETEMQLHSCFNLIEFIKQWDRENYEKMSLKDSDTGVYLSKDSG